MSGPMSSQAQLYNPYAVEKLLTKPIEPAAPTNTMSSSMSPEQYAKLNGVPEGVEVLPGAFDGANSSGVVESGKTSQKDFDAGRADPVASDSGLGGIGAGTLAAGGKKLAEGGSAEDALTAAAFASGNPYAMAAGLALGAFNANQKAKYQYKVAVAEAEQQQRDNIYKSARANQAASDRMKNLIS